MTSRSSAQGIVLVEAEGIEPSLPVFPSLRLGRPVRYRYTTPPNNYFYAASNDSVSGIFKV